MYTYTYYRYNICLKLSLGENRTPKDPSASASRPLGLPGPVGSKRLQGLSRWHHLVGPRRRGALAALMGTMGWENLWGSLVKDSEAMENHH